MREIKMQVFDPRVFRHAIETFHLAELERLEAGRWSLDGLAPSRQLERRKHPIHEFRLATQTIQVAFDEETATLHIGEREPGRWGWVEVAADAALRAGSQNPYLREVLYAARRRDEAEAARSRHAQLVLDAVARLKSPKSGVRRRAKRLLERLGR